MKHCPRCVARSRTLVELVASPAPADRLDAEGVRAPDTPAHRLLTETPA
jgi:hypothetical protein